MANDSETGKGAGGRTRIGRWLSVLRLTAASLALVGIGFWLGVRFGAPGGQSGRTEAPDLGAAPSYSLTDQAGRTVTSADFDGKVQVVTFLFPYCRTYCPLITAHLVGFERLLEKAGATKQVELVAFNLAPGDSGPKEMRTFLEQYGWKAGDRHWEFLTGSRKEIRRVVTKGFHVAYDRVPEGSADEDASDAQTPQPNVENKLADKAKVDYDISHNDALMVVDATGRVRHIYDQADLLSNYDLWRAVRPLLPKEHS